MAKWTVIIVGAGPSGLATAACLTKLSIPYVLLERDDCSRLYGKKYTYDRLRLHLSEKYVQLPYVKLPKNYPKYISKHDFIQYIDNYVALFGIKPLYQRLVESARFDHGSRVWRVMARNEGGGLSRPSQGPFYLKDVHGKYPVVDVGAYRKIKSQEIQVLPEVTNIRGNSISFQDGRSFIFDAIVLATGFKRSTPKWLQGDEYLLKEDGMPKPKYLEHWKGKDGLYCVGLARQGIYGLTMDAHNIAHDINSHL